MVITGKFIDANKSLLERSEQLYALSNCKLSCMTSKELGNIVAIVKRNLELATAIDWKIVFSNLIVDTNLVEKEVKRIEKDSLI